MHKNTEYIKKVVKVGLQEIVERDEDTFLDLLSMLATEGSPLLMDIRYQLVGIGDEPNTLMLEVTGDPSELEELQTTEGVPACKL